MLIACWEKYLNEEKTQTCYLNISYYSFKVDFVHLMWKSTWILMTQTFAINNTSFRIINEIDLNYRKRLCYLNIRQVAWVAQYLMKKEHKEYDLFLGTSTGSLMVSHLALDMLDELKHLYTNVNQKTIFSNNPFKMSSSLAECFTSSPRWKWQIWRCTLCSWKTPWNTSKWVRGIWHLQTVDVTIHYYGCRSGR